MVWAPAVVLIGWPLTAAVVLALHDDRAYVRAISGLYAAGFLLVLIPEFVYIQDVFGDRMNTVFKLYFQAWLLLSLASAGACICLWRLVRRSVGRWPALAAVPLVLALVVFIAFNAEGVRAQGPIGYMKSLVPGGLSGIGAVALGILEGISTVMRLISLTVRLFANILAGHMIILFMSGGLAVILGLQVLGWFTLPFGILVYLFELGLVATLQAFIFATLSAIYLGGAVTHH